MKIKTQWTFARTDRTIGDFTDRTPREAIARAKTIAQRFAWGNNPGTVEVYCGAEILYSQTVKCDD